MFIKKPNNAGIKFFNNALFFVFLAMLCLPLLGLFFRIEKKFEQTEMRKFAAMPKTSLATFYRDNWRQGIDKYFNDNFGLRGQMIKLANLVQFKIFHSIPLAKADTGFVLGTDTDLAVPTENSVTPATQPESDLDAISVNPDPSTANLSDPDNKPAADSQPSDEKAKADKNAPLPWVEHKVVIGKDGWLFFDKEKTIDDYRCLTPFTNAELNAIKNNLVQKKDWLAKQGIVFVVFIPPNKQSIYPEFLPDSIKKTNNKCRYNQVVELAKSTGVNLVDPRSDLIAKKSEEKVFYKLDTHWNDIGAFVSYQALLEKVHALYPDFKGRTWSDYKKVIIETPRNDLARLISLETVLKEKDAPKLEPVKPLGAIDSIVGFTDPSNSPSKVVVAKEVPGSTAPKVLVFRDSFFTMVIPFMSEDFARSVYVWSYGIQPEIVSAEKPDIVVLELVERYLGGVLINELAPKK